MRIFLFLVLIVIPSTMDSQEIKTHQWKNRIILVLSVDADSDPYKTQIANLKQESKGCAERKLVLYEVLQNQVTQHHFEAADKKPSSTTSELFKELMNKNDQFKVILIGLDGTVKEERSEPISSKELFEVIDSMAMRKSEMQKKN